MPHPSCPRLSNQRLLTLIFMALLVPLGLASKLYVGPGQAWAHAYLGGMVYVLFWCLAALWLLPWARAWRLALGVLLITSALEAAQLWQPAWLQQARGTFWGAALLGTTFGWWDFIYYLIGCLLAWPLMRWLQGRSWRKKMAAG